MLTFYTTPFSSNAQKVHFFMEAFKIAYEPRLINLSKGEQAHPDFLKINPFGVVPAIDHDGFHLGESNTILRYLARRFEKTEAYPTDLKAAARVDQMLDYAALHIVRWITTVNFQTAVVPMLGGTPSQAIIDDAKSKLAQELPKLERHLQASGDYLCGNHVTIADAATVPALSQAPRLGIDLSGSPRVAAYQKRMLAHPAWVVVAADLAKAWAAAK